MAGGEASRARWPTAVATRQVLGRAARRFLEAMRSLADLYDWQDAIHQIDQVSGDCSSGRSRSTLLTTR